MEERERQDALLEEERKLRRLRIIVDLTAAVLAQERLTIDEALDLMNAAKGAALRLFPGKEHTYNIIYERRFSRILKERFQSVSKPDNRKD
ncbi:MAG: hypothetical protein Kow0099_19270 [Candidatus Abyssubacteria bacterium]